MLGGIGAMVKHSTNTIPMIGSTAPNDSFNFSNNFVWYNFNNATPFYVFLDFDARGRIPLAQTSRYP